MFSYDHFSITEATQLQKEMAERISLVPFDKPIRTVAGADLSFNRFSSTVYAGIVVLRYPDMQLLSHSLVVAETTFPYVSGYLAFREIPALQRAWQLLPEKPDIVILDGQGITHPRKMGIAAHFGVLNEQPAIGCAKSMLFGKVAALPDTKYSASEITGKEKEVLGYALRTKDKVNPVYISPGHLVTAEQSLDILKNCIGKYRIPEPTRLAHDTVNLFRTGKLDGGYRRYAVS